MTVSADFARGVSQGLSILRGSEIAAPEWQVIPAEGSIPLAELHGVPLVDQDGDNRADPDNRDAWSTAFGNIETASGHRYAFEGPDPDVVTLEDIAHATSNICRFGGHVRRFYSVAEHSVLVSHIVEARGPRLRSFAGQPLVALLHDAHEAYIWDAPSPLKPLLGDTFKDLAQIADEIIAGKFLQEGYDADSFKAPIIKAADKTALVVEGRALLPVGPTDAEWEPLPVGVQWAGGMAPEDAKRLFLDRARELGL